MKSSEEKGPSRPGWTAMIAILVTAGVLSVVTGARAQPGRDAAGGMPQCLAERDECREDLSTCEAAGGDCGQNLSECEQDLEECEAAPGGGLPATGQDRMVVAGEDGNPAFGAPLSYTDTDNGLTVTDNNTGLVWEKKTTAADLNDVGNRYPWRGSCSVSGNECGTDVDCTAAETCDAGDGQTPSPNGLTIFEWVAALNAANFAGHNDWRIPNVKELQSIVDYGRFGPSIHPAFGSTASSVYWSATTIEDFPTGAWFVGFGIGNVNVTDKTFVLFVRAVRGGS